MGRGLIAGRFQTRVLLSLLLSISSMSFVSAASNNSNRHIVRNSRSNATSAAATLRNVWGNDKSLLIFSQPVLLAQNDQTTSDRYQEAHGRC